MQTPCSAIQQSATFCDPILVEYTRMNKSDDIKHAAAQLWAFMTHAFRKFLSDHCFSFAQSLTYTTIFAIIPVLAIAFSIFHALGGLDSLKDVIFVYLSEILTPGGQHLVQENLRELLEKAQTAPIGSFSTLFFIVIAFLLLMELEDVLNHIWSVSGHTLLRRIALYWLAFTLGPIIMVIPMLMALFLNSQVEGFQSIFALVAPFMQFLRLLPILSIWFFLWATYLFLPNTHIKPTAAALGTLVGGTLWLLAAKIYTIYNTHVLTYSKLYGSLGAIPVFLLWLFISWCVILYGAEVVYCCQYWQRIQREKRRRTVLEEVNSANILALKLVLLTTWRFQAGKQGLTLEELCWELGISQKAAQPVFQALQKHGVLAVNADNGRVLLSRAPNLLTVSNIWNAVDPVPENTTVLISKEASQEMPWERGLTAILSQTNTCFLQKIASLTVEDLLFHSSEAPAALEGSAAQDG